MSATVRTRPYSLANALAVVGDYWSLLVLQEVLFGVRRFNRIRANTGIRPNVLAVRLRKLVEHGVLSKELYEAQPPRYEYTLTEAGRELQPVLLALTEWGQRHAPRAQLPTERRHDCGAALHPRTARGT
ncbi:winged helix-turn-helix transcriptional regulator [Streptomyces sp. NPDC048419]|uniref:winged helix-turn-helix transcriptional regulator n=1 Tax=Streptomyces sp. NPDC048419 TaxID=3365547 RepID=UPI003715ABC6